MERVQIPNSQFFALAKELLHEGKKIEIVVKGNSMRPFLYPGETVVVAPIGYSETFRRYDIILAETSTGQVIMHRIHEITPDAILMKGDGNLHQTERVNRCDIMGKVVCVKRNGKHVSLYTPFQVFLARLWRPFMLRRVGLFFLRAFCN